MEIIPYTIYLFTYKKILYAVAKASEEITFGKGFKLIKDKKSNLNSKNNIYRRARRSVIAEVHNSLNAFKMFGDSVIIDDEINNEKLKEEEMKQAWKLSRTGEEYDKTLSDFPIINLSLKEAKELKLI